MILLKVKVEFVWRGTLYRADVNTRCIDTNHCGRSAGDDIGKTRRSGICLWSARQIAAEQLCELIVLHDYNR